MQYLSEYIQYLTDWSKERHSPVWAWPISWQQFRDECEREDEQAGREYDAQIQSMSNPGRYI